MQHIAEIMPRGRNALTRQAATLPTKAADVAIAERFSTVFDRVLVACSVAKATLAKHNQLDDMAALWFDTLARNSGAVTQAQIDNAIDLLVKREQRFLPTVIEFIDLCTLGDFPNRKDAYGILSDRSSPIPHRLHNHRMMKWMRTKVSNAFHPTTSSDERERTFNTVYEAAIQMERSGEMAEWERLEKERQDRLTRALPSKPIDPNLEMYRRLLSFAPEMAQEHLEECRKRGILLDVEAGNVTRAGVNIKQQTTKAI